MDVEITMTTTTSPASSSSSRLQQASTPKPKSQWSTSTILPSRQVRPDTFTPRSAFEPGVQIGKESDPGRMAIYLCLLDDRPHLHPSLSALHKHRLQAHSIPLPRNPETDHPIPYSSPSASTPLPASHSSPTPEDTTSGMDIDPVTAAGLPPVPTITIHPGPGIASIPQELAGAERNDPSTQNTHDQAEWVMWRHTDEELVRRKAYLPLA